MELLLAKGAETDVWDNRHRSPLHYAAEREGSCIRLAIERGCQVEAKDRHGYTPLHVAAAEGTPAAVLILMTMGADVNAVADDGETPLSLAKMSVVRGKVDLLRKGGASETPVPEPNPPETKLEI